MNQKDVEWALKWTRIALVVAGVVGIGHPASLWAFQETQAAATGEVIHTIKATETERESVLIHIPVSELPAGSENGIELKVQETPGDDFEEVVGQFGGPWLLDDQDKPHWLTFVVEKIPADKSMQVSYGKTIEVESDDEGLQWSDDQLDVSYGDMKLLSLEDAMYDPTSQETRDKTYKVFHHVYAPRMETPITKGPGGLFPHHRGLFYGFNRIGLEIDQKQVEVDTWHAKKAHQESRGVKQVEAGPVFARQVLEIGWINEVSDPEAEFATELREIVLFPAFRQMGIQFSSRLSSKAGKISIKGDPQHAGFQFRASQQVADETKDQTYYIRPDGVGKPGEYRNWPDQQDHIDLPFHGMCIELDDRKLTVLRLDREANPHPARYSERDYGRFGSYFETELDEAHPLEVKYQLRVFLSEIEVETAKRLSDGYWHQ